MSKLSSAEIARLTATITGGGYKRAKNHDAAEKRFLNVAAEAGIEGAAILAADDPRRALAGARDARPPAAQTHEEKPSAMARIRENVANAKTAAHPDGPKRTDWKALEAAARAGALPPPPDFSAPTHARFRAKLAELVRMAEADDVEGLRAAEINPVSTSPRAMARYRDFCVIAIEARVERAS